MLTQAASSAVVTVASAGGGVKGAYVQLLAATTFESSLILLTCQPVAGGGNFLVDIATGAGGAEVVLIPNIFISGVGLAQNLTIVFRIPTGARVAIRVSCAGGATNMDCAITLLG